MGGKLHVYKRPGSRFWQCSAYLAGRNRRASTKEESLALAKEFAEDWYLELRGKHRQRRAQVREDLPEAAAQFEREYEIITKASATPLRRRPQAPARLHLNPFFGDMGLSEITPGRCRNIASMTPREGDEASAASRPRAAPCIRRSSPAPGAQDRPAPRLAAAPAGPLRALPQSSGKISHRAWFSPEEYNSSTGDAQAGAGRQAQALSVGTASSFTTTCCSWPTPACGRTRRTRLEYRDVTIVEDETGETILEIVVRGKRGVGYCMSMPGAVTAVRAAGQGATAQAHRPAVPDHPPRAVQCHP
jgi:hypothetical protein